MEVFLLLYEGKYDITNIGIFEKEFPYEKEYLGKRIL